MTARLRVVGSTESDKARERERFVGRYHADPDAWKARSRQWQKDNEEQYKASQAEWREANRQRRRTYDNARAAARKAAERAGLSPAVVKAVGIAAGRAAVAEWEGQHAGEDV